MSSYCFDGGGLRVRVDCLKFKILCERFLIALVIPDLDAAGVSLVPLLSSKVLERDTAPGRDISGVA